MRTNKHKQVLHKHLRSKARPHLLSTYVMAYSINALGITIGAWLENTNSIPMWIPKRALKVVLNCMKWLLVKGINNQLNSKKMEMYIVQLLDFVSFIYSIEKQRKYWECKHVMHPCEHVRYLLHHSFNNNKCEYTDAQPISTQKVNNKSHSHEIRIQTRTLCTLHVTCRN